jgi:hypothetical protein
MLTDYDLEIRDFRPVQLIVVKGGPGAVDLPAAEALGAALRDQEARLRNFLESAGIVVPPPEAMGDLRIGILLFPDERTFRSWHERNYLREQGAPYVDPRDRRIVGWAGELDERCVRNLGTLLLLRIHRARFLALEEAEGAGERPLPAVPEDDIRVQTSFAWFDRGLALVLAGKGAEAPLRLEPTDRMALRFARSTQKLWPLEDLLFADSSQITARAGVRGGGLGRDELLVFAFLQGGLLVETLLYGEGGRWRDGFHALVRNEVQARSGRPYLCQAFGIPKKPSDPAFKKWIRDLDAACRAALD